MGKSSILLRLWKRWMSEYREVMRYEGEQAYFFDHSLSRLLMYPAEVSCVSMGGMNFAMQQSRQSTWVYHLGFQLKVGISGGLSYPI